MWIFYDNLVDVDIINIIQIYVIYAKVEGFGVADRISYDSRVEVVDSDINVFMCVCESVCVCVHFVCFTSGLL